MKKDAAPSGRAAPVQSMDQTIFPWGVSAKIYYFFKFKGLRRRLLHNLGCVSVIKASFMTFGLHKICIILAVPQPLMQGYVTCRLQFSCRDGCRCRESLGFPCPRAGPSGCSSCRRSDAAAGRPPPRRCPSCCRGCSACLYR